MDLARLGTGARASRRDLLERAEYPEAALAKSLQRLSAGGIVISSRGPGGGFRLARPPEEISLQDVIAAVDGEARAQECALGGTSCSESSWCPIHDHWSRAKSALSDMLRTTTIADLLDAGPARRAPAQRVRARHR
jgi:Rrf2 family protein